MSTPEVIVHKDRDLLADAVAARLVTRIVDAQSARGSAHVSLTGGTDGIKVLAVLEASPSRDSIDWSTVHVWWGDDRYVASDDPDRNEKQAREALLDHVPLVPAHVHPMPSTDSGLSADEAAAVYAEELRRHARPEDHAQVPSFDVTLLGMGPDGHINSLFPQLPAVHETQRWVVGVHGSPKPPPVRITLTFPAVQASREVWLIGDGEAKAPAFRLALSDAGQVAVPAAGARGRERTLVLLDETAASQLPAELRRIASP
ncbi:MAG TPA: 6-phosphogluconolactonase [Candidatus Nanopelagicales bacterium]|nr:6-phosphogluconolactonase [Candidatus Nanopelagicales bacterium]